MLLLRLVHILAGVTWVGAMIFTVFFLLPALKGEPATAGKVMQGLAKRRYLQIMPLVALATIISGFWMIWLTSGGHFGMYMQTASGHTFAQSGFLATAAFLIGFFVARPAAMKAGALGAQMATATDPAEKTRLQEEMTALQKRNGIATGIVTAMLLIAAAGMAIARYV